MPRAAAGPLRRLLHGPEQRAGRASPPPTLARDPAARRPALARGPARRGRRASPSPGSSTSCCCARCSTSTAPTGRPTSCCTWSCRCWPSPAGRRSGPRPRVTRRAVGVGARVAAGVARRDRCSSAAPSGWYPYPVPRPPRGRRRRGGGGLRRGDGAVPGAVRPGGLPRPSTPARTRGTLGPMTDVGDSPTRSTPSTRPSPPAAPAASSARQPAAGGCTCAAAPRAATSAAATPHRCSTPARTSRVSGHPVMAELRARRGLVLGLRARGRPRRSGPRRADLPPRRPAGPRSGRAGARRLARPRALTHLPTHAGLVPDTRPDTLQETRWTSPTPPPGRPTAPTPC